MTSEEIKAMARAETEKALKAVAKNAGPTLQEAIAALASFDKQQLERVVRQTGRGVMYPGLSDSDYKKWREAAALKYKSL